MASFTVNNGVIDNTPKTVSNNDIGTIEAGGTLSAATPITWTGGSNAPGRYDRQFGRHQRHDPRHRRSGSFAAGGSITVNNDAGATISATGNDAWRINNSLNAGGTITLNNAGTMISNGGQTLDFKAITSVNANIKINNARPATIRSTVIGRHSSRCRQYRHRQQRVDRIDRRGRPRDQSRRPPISPISPRSPLTNQLAPRSSRPPMRSGSPADC